MAHGDALEGGGEEGKLAYGVGGQVLFTLARNTVYPALLPLMPYTSAASSRLQNDAPHRADLNGLGPFLTKDEIWFLRLCHHISTGLYHRRI